MKYTTFYVLYCFSIEINIESCIFHTIKTSNLLEILKVLKR